MSRKPNILAKIATLLLLLSTALSLVLTPSLAAGENSYDFSRPTSPYNTTLGGAELLSMYGVSVSDIERAYLAEHSTVVLRYDDTITTSRIHHEYADGTLFVGAREFSYTAANGVAVAWIPTVATLGSLTSPLTKDDTTGMYTAAFDGVGEDASLVLSVEYQISFTISAHDMTALLRQAYDDAIYWESEIPRRVAEYERLLAEHQQGILDYDAYLAALAEHEAKYAVYLDYLQAKYIYDEKLALYEGYLRDLEAYHAAVENNKNLDKLWEQYYIDYARYREYLVALEEYEARYAKYEIDYAEYLEITGRLQDQLSAIEAAAIPMTMDRTVYSAVMGSMVTKVLENKTLITGSLVGITEEVVNDAGRATDNLRVLLKHYFVNLSTFEERYAYYSVNYEAFRDNFSLLLRTLDCLYRNDKVRGMLISQGYGEKYVILVAQLAHIANALSDTPIRSYYGEYTYGDKFTIDGRTVLEILEYKSYLTDTGSATPDPDGYPAPIPEPTRPDYMAEPEKPAKVEVPAYPDEVAHPGTPPAAVPEPKLPDTVEEPGEPPKPYTAPDEVTALVEAYQGGELDYILSRTAPSEDFLLPLAKSVTKRPFDPSEVTVSFFDEDGTLIEAVSVEQGTVADYTGEVPKKSPDAAATYEFVGWVYEDMVTDADLSAVTESVKVYPKFKATPRSYNITFRVGKTDTVLSYQYGTVPVYDGALSIPDDEYYHYTFLGWDKEISPVLGEQTYTATFRGEYILPFAGGGALVTERDAYYHAEAHEAAVPEFDITNLLASATASLGKGVRLTTRFADITISYATAIDMYNNGDTTLKLPITQILSHGYRYSVLVYSGTAPSAHTYRIDVTAPLGTLSTDGVLYHIVDGERRYVKHTKEEGIVAFSAQTGVNYEYIVERRVDTISTSLVTVGSTHLTANPGETVYVTHTLADGAILGRIYVVDSEGREIKLEGGRFIMPDSDVTIGATATLKEYKIIFKDGKRVIATQTYKHGDTVIPPGDPSKVSDNIYSYTFIGWGITRAGGVVDIPAATSDATYVAIYRPEIIYKTDDGDRIYIGESIMRLIVTGVVALVMLTLVVVPVIIISVIFIKRSKRMRKSWKKE